MTKTFPLEGLTVLDLSRVLAGPYCGMALADLGAQVVKIEVPGVGDDSRAFGPFVGQESAYFMSLNRNKESVTLNLKSDEGRGVFLRLVEQADILLGNFRPGTMDKLGLGYEILSKSNKRLIYAAISGFGNTGPYRLKAAYDVVVQGMGGIMSITGFPDGLPTRVGASIGDITAALFGAIGILAALHKRETTGHGQMVDVAMLDCQVAILENAIARFEVTGQVPERLGNRHPSITPFSAVPASDGHMIIAIRNDNLWQQFCSLVGRHDLAADRRFAPNKARTDNWASLEPILAEIFGCKPISEWIAALESAGVPCGPINTVDKVLQDPQIVARNMIEESVHPVAGPIRMAGSPIKMSDAPDLVVRQPAPMLGQHTEEVLSRLLALSMDEIQGLRGKGAL
ncbi:MAG: Acetyl-CoA:oxalate CoA-transferase [Firmicutes bacterium]|nr:Acetyl-CoA:oxalate CoA-transferase [Bacillota bacterium]